jgi:hypothetical protein
MAGIQQTFNQLLQTASLGVGLYSHSPAGQAKYADIKAKKAKEAEAKTEDPAAQAELGKVGQSSAQKALELSPTAERAETLAEYNKAINIGKIEGSGAPNVFSGYNPETIDKWTISRMGPKQSSEKLHPAVQRYVDRMSTLVDQKNTFDERIKALKDMRMQLAGRPEETEIALRQLRDYEGGKDGKK